MTPEYTGIVKWLYNWQTLIAGSLAFLAGLTAYWIGRSQVAAVNRQTRAVREQNEELQRQNHTTRARDSIIAARLIGGVLDRIEAGFTKLVKEFNESKYSVMVSPPPVPLDRRQWILRTDLGVVWNTLGNCGIEVTKLYLLMDMELTEFASSQNTSLYVMKNEVERLKRYDEMLRRQLATAEERAQQVLNIYARDSGATE